MKIVSVFALMFGSCFFGFGSFAHAEKSEFVATANGSQIAFKAQASLLVLSGQFEEFEARLALDRRKFENSQIELDIDISRFRADNPALADSPAMIPLRQAIPNPVYKFESKKITSLGAKRYRVSGIISQGSKRYQSSLDLTVVKQDANRADITFELSGALPTLDTGIPLNAQGMVRGRMAFLES